MKGRIKAIVLTLLIACCFVVPTQAKQAHHGTEGRHHNVEEISICRKHHSIEIHNKCKSSCTKKGYTGDKVCTKCGKTLRKGKYIPLKAHKYTYTDNKDGSHKAICKYCKTEKIKDHFYKKNHCVHCKASRPHLKKPVVYSLYNKTDGVKIKWKTVKNADSYEIYRAAAGGTYAKVGTTDKKCWIDENVENGKAYKYKVYAVKDDQKSKASVSKRACYVAQTDIDTLTNEEGRKLTLTWKANPVVSGYKIQYATKSNMRNANTKYVSKNALTKTISKLKKGRTYYVCICGYKKSSGNRYYAAWSTVKPLKIEK